MTSSSFIRSLGLDRYDLNARLRPALLVVLPLILLALYWIGAKTIMGSIAGIISACGVTYLMAQVARRRGRAVEASLGDRAGRRHSARLLTHADNTIAAETKARYHAFLVGRGLRISTVEEEKAEPGVAFERTRSAVDWLLEHTRPTAKESLLLEENIAYGFNRNLLGLKPIAIATLSLAIAAHVALMISASLGGASLVWPAMILLTLLGTVAVWILVINQDAVEDASLAYAQRLFSQCEGSEAANKVRKSSPRVKQL